MQTEEQKAKRNAYLREYRKNLTADQRAALAAKKRQYRCNDPERVRAVARAYRSKHPEHLRNWRKANPGKLKAHQRAYAERHSKEINKRRAIRRANKREQTASHPRPIDNKCQLCNRAPKKLLYYDHDHTTGAFRAWLCSRCNTLLGLSGDSIELLQKAIDLLKSSKGVGV